MWICWENVDMSMCECINKKVFTTDWFLLLPILSFNQLIAIDRSMPIYHEMPEKWIDTDQDWPLSFSLHCQVNRKTNHIFGSNEHLEGVGDWFTRDIFLICHSQWLHGNPDERRKGIQIATIRFEDEAQQVEQVKASLQIRSVSRA